MGGGRWLWDEAGSRSLLLCTVRVTIVVFLLQSDEGLVQQVEKEKREFVSVQSKLKIFEVFN